YPDPFGGSYVVEALTDDLVNEAFELIDKIDDLGGTISAIEQGWIQNEISNSAYSYQKDVDSGEQIIVGVNKFKTEESSNPEILKIDPTETQKQIDGLKSFKASRNNGAIQSKLSTLKNSAAGADNIMPLLIDCIKSGCTLGEVADALRLVAGEYK
ncbi:MAG: methylmalonyl-CoA mutase, partial [Bacteroidetes bacterium]|nr:methylmalonyl-CoA mutase [Bacteroidota bacterium]